MKKKLQGSKKGRDGRLFAFGGVILITFGVMLILDTLDITAKSVSFEGGIEFGILSLVVGVGFILLGWGFLKQVNKVDKNLAWSSVCITSGMAIVFLGRHIFYTEKTGMGRLWVTLVVMIVGIVVISIGLERISSPRE